MEEGEFDREVRASHPMVSERRRWPWRTLWSGRAARRMDLALLRRLGGPAADLEIVCGVAV